MRIGADLGPDRLVGGIARVAALLVASSSSATGKSAVTVTLLGSGLGGLRIANTGIARTTIERAIVVEGLRDGAWRSLGTKFNAVAACARGASEAPVTLAPAAILNVMPWRGFSCSGQCQGSCRNVYPGAGPFRFVVTTLPDHRRVSGPAFSMPARPSPMPGLRRLAVTR